MGIVAVKAVLQPPQEPREVPADNEAWKSVEDRLGTRLPQDYKAFIELFGTGSTGGFIWVFNPFSSNKHVNLIEHGRLELGGLASLKEEFPQDYVHDAYPTPGGLLPFAVTDNGDMLHWKTVGEPDHWTVIVYESRGPKYYGFDGSMTDFLASVLTRSVACDVFPPDFPGDHPTFVPLRE